MYSLIDKLIFPAPFPSYDYKSLQGKLIFIPKYDSNNKNNIIKQSKFKSNDEID